ncbi:MAG: Glu-tRNA(Gln) amidotransferase subunit GatE [Candidatus Diapherotrites archaeon]|nr:Glu-tRNA(Gln) amidotransferase subunit GatE [Candidatus Diapherotrites archaeon]
MENFASLGFKAGLEVHQQLDTGKLFCRCPFSQMNENQPDYLFERKLRAVASELGEFDPAALQAFKKNLIFEYHAFNACNCLIDVDEEPIQEPDAQALETTLLVSVMLNSKIFDELIVMRKTVIDGSNTSGFQRTILVAQNGKLKLSKKEIGIQTLALEEDSARPIEKKDNRIIYNLDRLGVPLIELATAPELTTPEEVKECALKIGEVFRRTCQVRRGLGTIRQDINISIKNGARTELKGVQQIELADLIVMREIQRQQALIAIQEELKKRKIQKQDLSTQSKDVTEVFKNTECKFLKQGIQENKKIQGISLNGFKGILGTEIQPGKRFGKEVSEYVKTNTRAGIIHSDELPAYGITEKEIQEVKKTLNTDSTSAFILVCDENTNALHAIETAVQRCQQALQGVLDETREVEENGNSVYLRPLPGKARMYPETDAATITITEECLQNLKKKIPKTIEERIQLYQKNGLSAKLADAMKLNKQALFFEELLEHKIDATIAAVTLLETLKQLEREHVPIQALTKTQIKELLLAYKNNQILKENIPTLLRIWASQPSFSLAEIIQKADLGTTNISDALEIIQKIVKTNQAIILEKKEHALPALMGDAMRQLKGKLDGQKIAELLKIEIQKMYTNK